MGPNERRLEIMEILCRRRHETMSKLADEFDVCVRTIKNDIDYLSLSYPIETICGRYGGGVKVTDGFYMNRKYLKPKQRELLERLSAQLYGEDLYVMKSIFKDFVLNKNHMKG